MSVQTMLFIFKTLG